MGMRLKEFFNVDEMPRTKGALSPAWRAALEKARQHQGDFDAHQFLEWLEAAGGNSSLATIPGLLNRLVPGEGERPSALAPLIVTHPGSRGRGGDRKRYRYAIPGSAGVKPKTSQDDGQDDEPEQATRQEPEPETLRLPTRDPLGSYAEVSMDKLASAGFDEQHTLWAKLGDAPDGLAAHELIRKELPITLQRPAVAVARELFQTLNKDWDGAASKKSPSKEPAPRTRASFEPEEPEESETDDDGFDVDVPDDFFDDDEEESTPLPEPAPKIQEPPKKPPTTQPKWNPFSKVIKKPKG